MRKFQSNFVEIRDAVFKYCLLYIENLIRKCLLLDKTIILTLLEKNIRLKIERLDMHSTYT